MAKRLDYDRWDKFDPDAEIERMEEEERQQRLKEDALRRQAPTTPADLLHKFPSKGAPPGRRVAAAAAQAQEPLRKCSEATLRSVAEELGLDPELIKLVARAMTFTEAQICNLSEDARFQTLRMRQAAEFEKVRFAIRRIAEAEQHAQQHERAAMPPQGWRVKGDIPEDDPEVLTAMSTALRLTESDLQALPEVERAAAFALRTDPKFDAIRQRVGRALGQSPPVQPFRQSQPSPAALGKPEPLEASGSEAATNRDQKPRDPIWDAEPKEPVPSPKLTVEDTIRSAATEFGLDSQLVRMCMQALRMTAEEVAALPYDAREKVKLVRDDADFAPLRNAAARAMEVEAEVEERLKEHARVLDLDPEGIRSCAVALGMSEEEVAALKTEKEREAIRGIRASDMFAPIRQICYNLGLAKAPESTATKASPVTNPVDGSRAPASSVKVEVGSEEQPVGKEDAGTSCSPDAPLVSPQPQVVALCRKALELSEADLAVLPEGTQANFRVLREDPAFAAVRAAVRQRSMDPPPTSSPTATGDPAGDTAAPPVQRPKWRFCHVSHGEGSEGATEGSAQKVVARIELPLLDTLQGVDVNVMQRELSVAKPGVYELQLPLPFSVDVDTVEAKWLRKPKVLQVTMTKL
eukprot:GGOE01037368.1.p1 GENE.GGOE01037368.1~~GGOE01037368.1.p1  ORF type:complete len:636 (-),score=175.57 GGOE01037368.1:221-2128(-)